MSGSISICRTVVRLPRFQRVDFYRWDATFRCSPHLFRSAPAHASCPGSQGSPICFTRPTWSNVLVLLAGVIPGAPAGAPSRRRCASWGEIAIPTSAPSIVSSTRAAWSSRAAAGRLLLLLVTAFVPSGAPVVIGIDDTIERRWGPKIKWPAEIYRDPVRSSKGHFVKASGLRAGFPPCCWCACRGPTTSWRCPS